MNAYAKAAKKVSQYETGKMNDKAAWKLIKEFWEIDEETDSESLAWITDKVRRIEQKLEKEHGWKR